MSGWTDKYINDEAKLLVRKCTTDTMDKDLVLGMVRKLLYKIDELEDEIEELGEDVYDR